MFIDLTQLEMDELRLEYEYPKGMPDLQDSSLALKTACRIVIRLHRRNQEVRARGNVLAELQVQCDRCLAPMDVPVDGSFDLIYLPLNSLNETDELILKRNELDFSFYKDDRIDLDELVREQIQLSLPMSSLCREDCKGLCVRCGKDLNAGPCNCTDEEVDPRWKALLDLKKKIN